jgi:hypothetical protein
MIGDRLGKSCKMWDITDEIRMRRGRTGTPKPYGQYIIDFDLVRQGGTVRIRSTWIVRFGEDLPRLRCFRRRPCSKTYLKKD